MKILIDQRDDWKPGDCYLCRCKCAPIHGINPECGLANSVEAVEYRVEDVVLTAANGDTATMANPKINGKPVTLYAVPKEADNGKV